MTIRDFTSTFYQNKAIIKFPRMPWWITAAIFGLSVFLATIPFYVSVYRPADYEVSFPHITNALYDFIATQDCAITNDTFVCLPMTIAYEGYTVVVGEEPEIKQPNTMYFMEKSFYATNGIDEIQGEYINLGDFRFQEVIARGADRADLVNVFLKNIEVSRAGVNLITITISYLFQFAVYTFVIGYLFRFAKGKAEVWPYGYRDYVQMITLSMLFPALVCAMLSFFLGSIATVFFPFVYVLRVVFLYMRLSRVS